MLQWGNIMAETMVFQSPVYIYAKEKGFLLLSAKRRAEHNVKQLNITLEATDHCLGGRGSQFLLESFLGYDTIILNNVVKTLGGRGYLYNQQTQELWNLNVSGEYMELDAIEYFIWKTEVALRSIILFVITTTLVAFCNRQTQLHIFNFTVQFRNQHRRPSMGPVIFYHLIESLVLGLVMVGVLLCVSVFIDDKTLALLSLFEVWWIEMFTCVSLRTRTSLVYFPRFVMCYFLLFYAYIIAFPLGYHYVAFLCLSFGIEHLMTSFFLHFEIPAVMNGSISYSRPRAIPLLPRSLFLLVRSYTTANPNNNTNNLNVNNIINHNHNNNNNNNPNVNRPNVDFQNRLHVD